MFRWIRSRFSALWENEREERKDSETTYQRSELDNSVLQAHGVDVDSLENEIADIEEQAQELEDVQRHR